LIPFVYSAGQRKSIVLDFAEPMLIRRVTGRSAKVATI
jgi:hypothetical protein